MRRILLNSLQLNAVQLNGIGEYQRDSHAGAPPVVPDVPDIPDIPEEPDVPPPPDVDENGYIIFEDAEVARICAENWGDGTGITLEQAAAVTDVGAVFAGNTTITSFDEFRFFTNIKNIGAVWTGQSWKGAFDSCTNLQKIKLPPSVEVISDTFKYSSSLNLIDFANVKTLGGLPFYFALKSADIIIPSLEGSLQPYSFQNSGVRRILSLGSLSSLNDGIYDRGVFMNANLLELAILPPTTTNVGAYCFAKASLLSRLILRAEVPPTLGASAFQNTPLSSGTGYIYVPETSVAAYREASGWADFASRIFPVSQMPTDNPDLYAEIQEYL